MPSEQAIYASIIGVMNSIGSIQKSSRNQSQGFNYRSVDAVMNALQPALVKNSVFILPNVQSITYEEMTTTRGTTMHHVKAIIAFKFISGIDGSFVEAVIPTEAMDTGDKATNKVISVALKYACFQVFCIPTEELRDSDAQTPELTIAFKSPSEAIQWAMGELNISEDEAKLIMESVEPDKSGKKARAFAEAVNKLKAKTN